MMRTEPTTMPSTPRPKATPHSTFSRRSEGSTFWGTRAKGEPVSPETWLGSPRGMTRVSGMAREKLRHGRLRSAQSENRLNKGPVEKEVLLWVYPLLPRKGTRLPWRSVSPQKAIAV